MSKIRRKSEDIRNFILTHVSEYPSTINKITAAHFKITRQAVNKHLQSLVTEGALKEGGYSRSKIYKLIPLSSWQKEYELTPSLAEDIVWQEDIVKVLGQMPENARSIWQYGFTEMFNNAIDHSGGSHITVEIIKTAIHSEITIMDNGVGIFKKIQEKLNLLDERHAVFELSKGKLTTDPSRHSGEGIFFSSRMFDSYCILSGGVFFSHEYNKDEDWVLESQSALAATSVCMRLNNHTARTAKKIFNEYTGANDFGFNKTVVPIKLAQYSGEQLISRSQAKRLLARIELFKIVIFDFKDITEIGQAFADEIFRVFAIQHPEIELKTIHDNSNVRDMVSRAKLLKDSLNSSN